MTTTMRTATLPATGRRVAPYPFTVGSLRQWQTRDGVGFILNLHVGRELFGTVEEEGNGGGAWFRPAMPGARAAFDAFVAATAALDPETYEVGACESICNDLVDEADLRARLTETAAPHLTLARRSDDPAWGHYPWRVLIDDYDDNADGFPYNYVTIPHPLDDGLAAHLRTDGWYVWNGQEWIDP